MAEWHGNDQRSVPGTSDQSDDLYGSGSADPLTEQELTALALAADPSDGVADDAVPLADFLGQGSGLLPAWYMPAPMARRSPRWRLPVVLAIVGAFLLIEAVGLCSTFGQLVPG